jgi:hypothetical protein
MTKIIGLCGPQGAGKSRIAAEAVKILTERGYLARVVSIAAPIRLALGSILMSGGMTSAEARHAMLDRDAKEQPLDLLNGKSPRYALQTLGTEWGRCLIAPDLWTDLTFANIAAAYDDHVAIIDDVRFDSEVEAVRAKGGKVVEISRIGAAYSDVHPTAMRPAFRSGEPIPLYNGGLPQEVARTLLLLGDKA